MPETPEDDPRIARARAAWRFRGQKRPDFAVEPGPDQASVWDYPRPPAILPEPRPVRVLVGAVTLADSNRAVRVCETGSPPTLYSKASQGHPAGNETGIATFGVPAQQAVAAAVGAT
ncbi:MAG: hypothetical protein KFB96_25980 [Thiocapsa sp.]|uniref:hypothetical protein n=1 Tax=Thiocapsa sp. TaxID=2024551 RepID=UPI001BCF7EA1|nr:hypothetical protein [Thiocapsa sp.]QVL48934.1 MAG: hypothetical protein KFB96_25980 [Thiocapsa sp.]